MRVYYRLIRNEASPSMKSAGQLIPDKGPREGEGAPRTRGTLCGRTALDLTDWCWRILDIPV